MKGKNVEKSCKNAINDGAFGLPIEKRPLSISHKKITTGIFAHHHWLWSQYNMFTFLFVFMSVR